MSDKEPSREASAPGDKTSPRPWRAGDEIVITHGDSEIAREVGEPLGPREIVVCIVDAAGGTVAYLPWDPCGDTDKARAAIDEAIHAVNSHDNFRQLAIEAADLARLLFVENFPADDIASITAYERLRRRLDALRKAGAL